MCVNFKKIQSQNKSERQQRRRRMCALCKGARATVRATWSWCCVLSTGNRVGFRRYNSRLSNYPFSHGIPFRRNAIIERFTRSAEKSIEINNDSALAVPLRRNAKCLQPIFFYAQSIGHSWHKTISLARSCRTCSIFFLLTEHFFFLVLLVTIFFSFCYTSLRTNPYRTIPISAAGWSGRPFFSSGNRTAKNRIFLPNGLEIRVVIFFLFV